MAELKKVVKYITIDTAAPQQNPVARVKRGDRGTRYLSVLICDGRKEYEIPPDALLRVNWEKPDGHICYNVAEHEEGTNRVLVELTNQMLLAPGIAECDVEVISADNVQILSSAVFCIEIEDGKHNDEAMLSTDEMTALEKITERAEKAKEESAASAAAAAQSATDADQSATDAAASAAAAKTSETNAKASETAAAGSAAAAAQSATDADQSASSAAGSAAAAKTSETNATDRAIAAAQSATDAEKYAELAGQVAEKNGYVYFEVDEKGHLLETRTDNASEELKFRLNEGRLEVTYE